MRQQVDLIIRLAFAVMFLALVAFGVLSYVAGHFVLKLW